MNAVDVASGMIQQGQYHEALKLLATYIEQTPDDAEAWYLSAYIYAISEYPAEALHAVTRAIQLRPGAAMLHTLAGDMHLMMGAADNALACYTNAFHKTPHDAAAFVRLFHHALVMDNPLAVDMEKNIVRFAPAPDYAGALADAYASAGLTEKAVRWFDQARAGSTGDDALRYSLEAALMLNDDAKVPALLAQYSPDLARHGAELWAQAHETFAAPKMDLTCAVTTNLTKKLKVNAAKAPPKLDLIAETLASWRTALQPDAHTRVLIYFDQPRDADPDAALYAARLADYANQYGYEVVLKQGNGLKNNVLDALQQTTSGFFTLLEHDFLFANTPPQARVMDLIANHSFMHFVQFNRRPNVATRWDAHLWPDSRVTALPLLRTPKYSNNPAIARVDKIRAHIVPLFSGANAFDGTNAGAGGLEEQVRVHILAMMKHFGFGFTHRWTGYYLYGKALEPARLTHTGI